jgi:hypothetical protein
MRRREGRSRGSPLTLQPGFGCHTSRSFLPLAPRALAARTVSACFSNVASRLISARSSSRTDCGRALAARPLVFICLQSRNCCDRRKATRWTLHTSKDLDPPRNANAGRSQSRAYAFQGRTGAMLRNAAPQIQIVLRACLCSPVHHTVGWGRPTPRRIYLRQFSLQWNPESAHESSGAFWNPRGIFAMPLAQGDAAPDPCIASCARISSGISALRCTELE